MIITALITGFQRIKNNARLLLWLYLLNVGFALVAAIPLHHLIKNKVGNSMAISRLMPNFDYTIIQDFLREYGSEMSVILQEAQFLILFYFIFSIFLTGGILEKIQFRPQHTFLQGGATHFWRLLRLTIYFILIYLLVLVLLGSLFNFIFIENFANYDSERPVVHGAGVFALLFIFIAILIAMVQDYAKIQVVHLPQSSVFRAFWNTWYIVFQNFSKTFTLYMINILMLLVVFGLYWWASGYFHPVDAGWKILITFLLSQLFIVGRIMCKLLNLGSATVMYERQLSNH